MLPLVASALALAASPSCSVNGTACPPPTWAPQWNLTLSTICQPGDTSDYWLPPVQQPWGLVSLDWSIASGIWRNKNMTLSTVEATSIENCRRIKAQAPTTRCFIYHNMELALQAFESQRAVMYDPSKANWFLQFTDGQGNKNGTIYNEPGGPGDQFFWDFRVPAAADYFISSVLSTLTDPAIDGTFTDDVVGFPAEHTRGPGNIKMNASDLADLQYATLQTSARLIDQLVALGKYNWQAFDRFPSGGSYDGVGAGVDKSGCTEFMRARCTPAFQSAAHATTYGFDASNKLQSLAGFLVTRPPIAFLGNGWESDQRKWDPLFLTDVGEPTGDCAEGPAGVFTRGWTRGNASLDCNAWVGVVPGAQA